MINKTYIYELCPQCNYLGSLNKMNGSQGNQKVLHIFCQAVVLLCTPGNLYTTIKYTVNTPNTPCNPRRGCDPALGDLLACNPKQGGVTQSSPAPQTYVLV